MPWKPSDAKKHKKGLTKEQAKEWAKIANSVRKQCIDKGGNAKECDARAIRVANSKVGKKRSNNSDNDNKEIFNVNHTSKKKVEIPNKAFYFKEEAEIQLSEPQENGVRYFSMRAYSGKLMQHWLFGKIAIDVNGIGFGGKKRIPILEEHDRIKKVGVSNSVPLKDNNQVFFEKIKLLNNPTAKEFEQNLDDDFPYQCSINIRPEKIEELSEGVFAEVNGQKMKGPGSIIRQSVLRESSVCVFGVDSDTSIQKLSDDDKIGIYEIDVISCSDSLNQEEETDIDYNDVGGNMDINEFKEQYPDLYKEIVDAHEKELSDLRAENENLKNQNTQLSDDKEKLEGRVGSLEQKFTEQLKISIKKSANEIVNGKLSASEIPQRFHDKVRKQINHEDFVSENVLDVEKFTEAVNSEIESWAKDFSEEFSNDDHSKILGLGNSTNLSEEGNFNSDELSDHMVSLVTKSNK